MSVKYNFTSLQSFIFARKTSEMKNVFLFASIILASGLFFTNTYNSLIDARSWGSAIPHSIAVTREYYSHVNPGNFFRIFSPLNQVLAHCRSHLILEIFPGGEVVPWHSFHFIRAG